MKSAALLAAIENALFELGPANHLGAIQQGLRSVSNFPALLYTDIYMSTAVAANTQHPFWSLCPLKGETVCNYGDYCLRFFWEGQLPLRKLGEPAAAIGVVVLDENLNAEENLLYYFKRATARYAMLIVLNYTADTAAAKTIQYDLNGKLIAPDMSVAVGMQLSALLEEQLPPVVKEQVRERSFLNTLEPLLQLTREAIQQEQHLVGVRKNINNQLGNLLRKDEAGLNINDTVNIVKTQLQYWSSDTEKIIKSKYEELNKPNTGRYSQALVSWTEELTDIERRKVAEKSERLITVIPPPFLQAFEKQVGNEISTDFASDYNLLLSGADNVLGSLNFLLEQKGITTAGSRPLMLDYSRFPNPEKTLRNYVGFTRVYSGELSKKGAAEYFAALREHTGSIMVAVGLLAPLNMIASAASGESSGDKNSFLGKISVVFRHMNNAIRIATAIIIVVMIIWGYFDLRKRIPRKRVEEFERELKKAKESLLAEGKRMFSDASKDWQSNINIWLREAYAQMQLQLEKAVREYSAGLQQKLNEEKMRIQRLNQGLDNNTRRISMAERSLDSVARNHRDALTDLERASR